jgi:hypothetical protein
MSLDVSLYQAQISCLRAQGFSLEAFWLICPCQGLQSAVGRAVVLDIRALRETLCVKTAQPSGRLRPHSRSPTLGISLGSMHAAQHPATLHACACTAGRAGHGCCGPLPSPERSKDQQAAAE